MANTFQGANVFNADISRWNTASVTNMNSMFSLPSSSVGNPLGRFRCCSGRSGSCSGRRWGRSRCRREDGIHGGVDGSRCAEDWRHQGSPYDYRFGAEGSQGSRRRRPEGGEGKCFQGRSRKDQEAA
jgi:surface protein